MLIRTLILIPDWLEDFEKNPEAAINALFQYQEVQKLLRVNLYKETLYFHYESLIELLAAFYSSAILSLSLQKNVNKTEMKKNLEKWHSQIEKIINIAAKNSSKVYPTIEAILAAEVTNNK